MKPRKEVKDLQSVGIINSQNKRRNRFPSSLENRIEVENLFTRIFELLIKRRYAEAEQNLDLERSLDPFSGEAILCWTELKLCQGELDAVIERVGLLAQEYPTNAYYFLSQVLLEVKEWSDDPHFQSHIQMDYDDYVEQVAECGGGSSDVFAKIGLVSIRRGMWKTGMSYFIQAIKAQEKEHDGPANLIFLCERNEDELGSYLDCLPMLDDEPDSEVIDLIVKTICVLLIAYEDLGIGEAWPVAVGLANRCPSVAESWNDLSALFDRFCPRWVEIQRTDGDVALVRARIDGLVPSHLLC